MLPVWVENAYSRPKSFGGLDPLYDEAYQRNPQKAHPWAERRHMSYRSSKSVHRCDLYAWRRDQKRQRRKHNSGKLGIRRNHSRCRIEMKSCMVGGLQMLVLRFEFHKNRLGGFGAVGGRNLPIPTDLAIDLYNSLYYQKILLLQHKQHFYILTFRFLSEIFIRRSLFNCSSGSLSR